MTTRLLGRLPAAVTGPVVDDKGLGPGGMDADAETGELVVPGDPGPLGGLEGVDGALGERGAHLRGAFSGVDFSCRQDSDLQVYGQHCGQHLRKNSMEPCVPRVAPLKARRLYANLLNTNLYVPATVRQYPLCPNINTSLIT